MKFFKNFKITNKGLYWGLIITFALLYLCVGFVSTLHSITFFHLANTVGLAILLGLTYEIGQASVLFSILMTKNKDKFLPWALMFLLTALQVTANVYASFKFMVTSGSTDWQYWQKSILIGVQATNAEMYQVIISWIAGALLPIVALGMTALVAQNIKLASEEEEEKVGSIPDEEVDEVIKNEVDKRVSELVSTNKVTDLEKPSELIDFDETGIGGEPTKEQEQEISDFITEEKRIVDDLDKDAAELTPIIEDDILTHRKQALEDLKYTILKDVEESKPQALKDIEKYMNEKNSKDQSSQIPIDQPPKKKLGRPPKQKDVVELKKDQELLPSVNVEVPQKSKRRVNPLKLKDKKIKPIKSLDEVIKPSKGDEVIALLEKQEKDKVKDTIIQPVKDEDVSPEISLVPPELLIPYLESGVEVIDAKAIPKLSEEKKN